MAADQTIRSRIGLVGIELDHTVAFDQRQVRIEVLLLRMPRPHVVGVGQAKVFVESLAQGQERLFVSEMPLAKHRRRVAALLQDLRDGELVRVEAMRRRVVECPGDADPVRIRTGKEGRSRGGT